MPGPKPKILSEEEIQELLEAEAAIPEARKRWAQLVRRLGISGVARFEGTTSSSVSGRVRAIEEMELIDEERRQRARRWAEWTRKAREMERPEEES
jgi:hypothetical protein